MDVTVIVPAYNEEKSVGEVARALREEYPEHEVLVIDDGSSDGTAEAAKRAGAKVIRHAYNMGYGAAIKTGMRKARGEVVVVMDADGQHETKDVGRILAELERYDMVIGAREKGSAVSLIREPGKKVLFGLARYLARRKIPDLNSGFRGFRKDAALRFAHFLPNGFSLSTTLTLAFMEAGLSVGFIPVRTRARVGKSTVGPSDAFGTLILILRTIMLFSPLRIFVPISGGLAAVAVAFGIYDVAKAPRGISDSCILFGVSALLVFLFGLLADQLSIIRKERGR